MDRASNCSSAAPPLYHLAMGLLVVSYVMFLLPCILVILLLPVLCFCLPCIIRVFGRLQVSVTVRLLYDMWYSIP